MLSVSYTHLDVYKRQVYCSEKIIEAIMTTDKVPTEGNSKIVSQIQKEDK